MLDKHHIPGRSWLVIGVIAGITALLILLVTCVLHSVIKARQRHWGFDQIVTIR